jgi:hypothetical protein
MTTVSVAGTRIQLVYAQTAEKTSSSSLIIRVITV